jgi:hypothetical protein
MVQLRALAIVPNVRLGDFRFEYPEIAELYLAAVCQRFGTAIQGFLPHLQNQREMG